jgi:hypothetical protein
MKMSNVSLANPFVVVSGIVVGTVIVAKWLMQQTKEDRVVVENLQEQRRRDRLLMSSGGHARRKAMQEPTLTSAVLHMRDPKSLQGSAEKLGYIVVGPHRTVKGKTLIKMQRDSGERLIIEQARGGNVSIVARDASQIAEVVRQHTEDMTVKHMEDRGMSVTVEKLPNGETRITGTEYTRKPDGVAKVKTDIHDDGTAQIDVDNIRGSRCLRITSDLATEVGWDIVDERKKGACYQLPIKAKRGVEIS